MKTTTKTMMVLLALGISALAANAQDDSTNTPPPGMDGPGPRGHHPPIPAIVRALDVNHDGVIDADEIANASAELKTLDKNGDGKLTPDEYMGPRPQGRPPGDNNSGPDAGNNNNNGNDAPPGPPPSQ